jgi:glycosyltransferase involved in cell wall biosynthesis
LCEDSAVTGYSNRVAAFCSSTEDPSEIHRRNLELERFDEGRLQWALHGRSHDRFRAIVRAVDGVHIHGIWEHHCSAAAALLREEQKPYVVSAHGMLDRWALRSKRLKKALYSALVERRNLAGAACLRALTHAEVEDYRNYGLTNPVAVIPNGVTIPDEVSSNAFLEAFPNLRNKRIVLFLGRLHYKKGLDILCKAWSALDREFTDAYLVLAGPDFDNTRARTESLVQELGITGSVTFTGMLKGNLKWSALSASTVFVLPSYSEGFSVAILEALGVGLPVVVTPQCNFPEIESSGCGWLSEANASELENVLGGALATDTSTLEKMGNAGRVLARERYSWPVVREQMAEVYEWINGGARPAAVHIF